MVNKVLPNSSNNIDFVVSSHLCTSCGACEGVCPKKAVNFCEDQYGMPTPRIDLNKCNMCGICVKVCPGYSFSYTEYQTSIFNRLPEDVGLGNHLECCVAYSKDSEILNASQSGGLVSTLLIQLLEQGNIDGAVVSRRSAEDVFKAETIVAKNRQEVLSSVGSIYNSVQAASRIDYIRSNPGKYAFVGTSCQVQAMRKAENYIPEIKERVVLYIGLHCLGIFTNHFYNQMLHKARLGKDEISYYRHRDKAWRGWPGDMRISTKAGETANISGLVSRIFPRPYFSNWRCQLCFDKANEFSDISCGDCRVPSARETLISQGYDLKKGLSEVVVRTDRGLNAINSLRESKLIATLDISCQDLYKSNGLAMKKVGLKVFFDIAKVHHWGIPQYDVDFSINVKPKKSSLIDIIFSLNYIFYFKLNRYRLFRSILLYFPHSLMIFQSIINKYFTKWGRMQKTSSVFAIINDGQGTGKKDDDYSKSSDKNLKKEASV